MLNRQTGCFVLVALCCQVLPAQEPRRPVPREHPRLLGSREELKRLSRERPEAYRRVLGVARGERADDHSRIMSLSLAAAIETEGAVTVKFSQTSITFRKDRPAGEITLSGNRHEFPEKITSP